MQELCDVWTQGSFGSRRSSCTGECYGLNCISPKIHKFNVYILVPEIVTIFKHRDFKVVSQNDAIKLSPNPTSLTVIVIRHAGRDIRDVPAQTKHHVRTSEN
jgi:hypothetical protein